MSRGGVVVQVSVSVSRGGLPKLPVDVIRVGRTGIEGDGHRHRKIHGGPERAVCLYSLEVIRALVVEGHPIHPGSAGENVTVSGLSWDLVVPGATLALGDEVLLAVASYTAPCKTIAASFVDRRFRRIDQRKHPGWSRVYARVLREGAVRCQDRVALIS